MTVFELIERLQKMDADDAVVFEGDGGVTEIKGVASGNGYTVLGPDD